MKKILLALFLGFLSVTGFSQTGMQGVIVEKLYTATAADHAADPNLPVGAVTYRVFLDMQSGWKLASIFGDVDNVQNIVIKTTSPNGFYNVSLANGGKRFGHQINYASLATGTLKFDTWLAFGGAAAPAAPNYYHGIVKSVANPNGIITLTTPTKALTAELPAGEQITLLYPMLDGTSTANDFTSGNFGLWDLTAANWVEGPNTDNQLLIGQFTTEGDFSYQFNVKLQGPAPANLTEYYVAEYELAGQYAYPALKGTMLAPTPPTVSGLTVNPVSIISGGTVVLSVTATDAAPGSISKVEFFRGTTKLTGTVTNAGSVYSLNYVTDVVGSFNITAVATDNANSETTSSAVSLTVLPVPANSVPVVNTLTVPADANVGSTINGSATASDADGTIASIQFYVNNIAVGAPDASSPFEFSYTAPATEQILTIKAVATDNQGGKSPDKIAYVTIKDPAGGYKLLSSKVNCQSSDFFYVPVATKGSGVSNAIGFDLIMKYNPSKVRPTGVIRVNNDLIADSLWTSSVTRIAGDSITISLFLNSNAPAGTFFGYTGHTTGKVLRVEFAKTVTFQPNEIVNFTVPSFVESYITGTSMNKSVDAGYFETYAEKFFTGKLKFWADNSPITFTGSTATSLITNIFNFAHTYSVQPDDVKGEFSYDITNGLKIEIVRDVLPATDVMDVVNGYDAYLTQKVVLSDKNFRPNVYQIMAMDVNLDGKVSAGDVSQINQRTVKAIPEFKQKWNYNDAGVKTGGDSFDWTWLTDQDFVNPQTRISENYPLPDSKGGYHKNNVYMWGKGKDLHVENPLTCPIIYNQEFQGLMLGDVDGSYKNIAPLSKPGIKGSKSEEVIEKALSADNGKVVFDLSKASINDGFITFPISVSAGIDVNSLDFAMKFDESKLTFKSVFNHLNNLQSLGYYNTNDKTLRVTSFSVQNYTKEASVISLRFEMKEKNLTTEDLTALKAFINGAPASIEYTKLDLTISELNERILRVFPNPAKTVINVELSENATIQILDINGKIVRNGVVVNAYQRRDINVADLPQGMYLMKFIMNINDEEYVTTKKIVIKK